MVPWNRERANKDKPRAKSGGNAGRAMETDHADGKYTVVRS